AITDMQTLAQLAGGEPIVAKAIMKISKTTKLLFRFQAINLLGVMAENHPKVQGVILPAIITGVKHSQTDVRLASLLALSRFGKTAKKYAPLLKKMKALDKSEQVRDAAGQTLAALEIE